MTSSLLRIHKLEYNGSSDYTKHTVALTVNINRRSLAGFLKAV